MHWKPCLLDQNLPGGEFGCHHAHGHGGHAVFADGYRQRWCGALCLRRHHWHAAGRSDLEWHHRCDQRHAECRDQLHRHHHSHGCQWLPRHSQLHAGDELPADHHFTCVPLDRSGGCGLSSDDLHGCGWFAYLSVHHHQRHAARWHDADDGGPAQRHAHSLQRCGGIHHRAGP